MPAKWRRTRSSIDCERGITRWRVSTTCRRPSGRRRGAIRSRRARRRNAPRPPGGGAPAAKEMLHAAMADLVARGGDEDQVGIDQPLVGETGDRQEPGDAGRALAGAGEPARHRRRHDDRATFAAVEAADDVAARHVVPVAALDRHRHRPARLLGGIEQGLVAGGDQDDRHRPGLALLIDVVGVDLATRVVDGQQHGGGMARERLVQRGAVRLGQIGRSVEGQASCARSGRWPRPRRRSARSA